MNEVVQNCLVCLVSPSPARMVRRRHQLLELVVLPPLPYWLGFGCAMTWLAEKLLGRVMTWWGREPAHIPQ
jgi:hypothetical protein